MTEYQIIYYIIIFWSTGFMGGMIVLLTDYREYDRDVTLGEFLRDTLLTLVAWPTIIHHIVIYVIRLLGSLLGINVDKLKNIVIVKGSKK